MLNATWFGACQRCDCGRTVTIERGGAEYLLTGTDPDFEVVEIVDLTELAERIRDATDGAEQTFDVYGDYFCLTLSLTDGQLADLRAWALGEVAA